MVLSAYGVSSVANIVVFKHLAPAGLEPSQFRIEDYLENVRCLSEFC